VDIYPHKVMTSERTKIIIIDDEVDLCFLLGNMLTTHYEVSSFFTLEEGMEGIQKVRPNWLILDNDLPDGRGWDRTNEILRENPGIQIIKISANPDSERTHDLENVHYLIKPIHVNSITELIRKKSYSS
jgi:DNA-binding NtrC family response regulator